MEVQAFAIGMLFSFCIYSSVSTIDTMSIAENAFGGSYLIWREKDQISGKDTMASIGFQTMLHKPPMWSQTYNHYLDFSEKPPVCIIDHPSLDKMRTFKG